MPANQHPPSCRGLPALRLAVFQSPCRLIPRRVTPLRVSALVLLTAALFTLGCQREENVVRYKPFFTGITGAEVTRGAGAVPVNPDLGHIDPTKLPADAKLIVENPDGSKTLIAKSLRHMMGHLERCLDEGEDELLMDQVISEKTKQQYRSEGKDPQQIIRFLKRNRKDIAKLFSRMPMGEYTPTVILEQPGDKMWAIRLTGAAARDMKFTKVWARLEEGHWRFVWVE